MEFQIVLLIMLGCVSMMSAQYSGTNCAAVLCARPLCLNPITIPGQCCPRCPRYGIGTSKPGRCPMMSGIGICVQMCSSDFHCRGPQKCCSNGCGRVCMDPIGFRG